MVLLRVGHLWYCTAMENLLNRKFGRWTVLEGPFHNGRESWNLWLCACNCGTKKKVNGYALLGGMSKSCGCLHRQIVGQQSTKHGLSYRNEYWIYWGIKQRCENPKNPGYAGYGGRGIYVEWTTVEEFVADMGARPSLNHTIERIDNDGPYSKDNCRWATKQEQNFNKRSNHTITFNDKTQTITEWSRETGFHKELIRSRLARGWTPAQALSTPPGCRHQ